MISDWLRRVRPESTREAGPPEGEMSEIPVDVISPNPYQPRQTFHEGALRELADSIGRVGVLEPVLVRPHPKKDSSYQLLVGERRLRAAKIAGLRRIPAVVRSVDDSDMALLGLVENLQREDLHPLEEAAAMRRMLREFEVTQEELARGLGFSQSTISNKLRLLQLPEAVRQTVIHSGLSERHARCLLQLSDEDVQMRLAREISSEDLSVKATEDRIRAMLEGPKPGPRRRVKGIVRDLRIFLNGLRQTVAAIREAGFDVEARERELEEGFEMVIRVTGRIEKPEKGSDNG